MAKYRKIIQPSSHTVSSVQSQLKFFPKNQDRRPSGKRLPSPHAGLGAGDVGISLVTATAAAAGGSAAAASAAAAGGHARVKPRTVRIEEAEPSPSKAQQTTVRIYEASAKAKVKVGRKGIEIQHNNQRQNKWAHIILACMHSSSDVMQGFFYPSTSLGSFGSFKQAALCMRARKMHSYLFYLGQITLNTNLSTFTDSIRLIYFTAKMRRFHISLVHLVSKENFIMFIIPASLTRKRENAM